MVRAQPLIFAAAITLATGLAIGIASCGSPGAAADTDVAEDARDEVSDPRAPHERIDLPSLATCAPCHLREYEEWAASLHHRAWTNDNVRTATAGFERTECRPCHSPMPVLTTGLDVPPAFRDFNHRDGVHCLSCHDLEDGVAAARTIEGAPCRPRFDERLFSARMCWPCHEPTHQAFQEYETSTAFRDDVRCADCHMPERDDGSGHSHGPNGGMNPQFVRRGVRWTCRIESEDGARELLVTLRNRTGHKFPGEIPSRSFVVRVTGVADEPRTELLRRPHKGEARADNRLLPDEERLLRFPLPAAVDEAEVLVEFLWLPLPLLPIEQAFVLGEWRPDGPTGTGNAGAAGGTSGR